MTEEKKPFDYQRSMEEIESIIRKIEEGDLDIDSLSGMVKRAAELMKDCRIKLRETEDDLEKTLNDLED